MAPSLFDDARKARYLELREGTEGRPPMSRSKACRELNITISTVRHACTTDDVFAGQVELLEAEKVEEVEDALHKAALEGSVPAAKFFLTNRAKEDWEERQVVDNQGHQQTQVTLAVSVTDLFSRLLTESRAQAGESMLELIDGEFKPVEPAVAVDEDVLELEPAE